MIRKFVSFSRVEEFFCVTHSDMFGNDLELRKYTPFDQLRLECFRAWRKYQLSTTLPLVTTTWELSIP